MDIRITIECKGCCDRKRGRVVFGDKSNERVGVSAILLPPGWEARPTDPMRVSLMANHSAVSFMCPKCAKKPTLAANDTDATAEVK